MILGLLTLIPAIYFFISIWVEYRKSRNLIIPKWLKLLDRALLITSIILFIAFICAWMVGR